MPRVRAGPGDSDEEPRRSRLVLYEDGAPLGPRHALYDDVATLGGGRYLHYGEELFFSSCDNTSPNGNGRLYSWALGEPTPKILAMGGCHLHSAVAMLHGRGAVDARPKGSGVSTSSAEHLSFAKQGMGVLEHPSWLKPLTYPAEPGSEPEFLRAAEAVDVLVVEITANLSVAMGPSVLVRNVINTMMKEVILSTPAEARSAMLRWYSQAIAQGAEELRVTASQEASRLIQGSEVDTPLIREMLASVRGLPQTPQDIVSDLEALQDLLGCRRLVLVGAPNLYMPDGRGVSLYPSLRSDLRAAAQALSAPLIDVGELVLERGGDVSVMPDLIHLTPEFLHVLSDQIMDTVDRLIAAGRS